jgi:hypothetical protein
LPLVVRPSVRQSVRQVTLYHAHDPKLFVLHATTIQASTTPVALPPPPRSLLLLCGNNNNAPKERKTKGLPLRRLTCLAVRTGAAGVQTRRRSLAAACRQLTLLLLCRAALLLPLPLEDEEETMHDYSCAMLINQCSLLLWLFTELIFTALYLYDGAARPG